MAAMSEILTHLEGEVLRISFNRTEKMNALSRGMYQALAKTLNEANQDFGVRAVILTGEGEHFTAGNDIGDFLNNPPSAEESAVLDFLNSLHNFAKPLIAAVKGNAVGVGTTMLLHCDIVIASADAKFLTPFTNLGLVPEAGSSYLLPRALGHHKAAEMFFTGDAIAANEAPFVNHVVADPLALATEIANKISKQPPQAIINTKALMKANIHEKVAAVMQAEMQIFAMALQSDEAKIAFERFLARKGGK